MINKKIASEVAIGIVVLIAVSIGGLVYFQNDEAIKSFTNQQTVNINQEEVKTDLISSFDSDNQKISQENKQSFSVKELCEGGSEIVQCGQYYEKYPSIEVVDAPIEIYDQNGRLVGYCGGMPGPNGPIDSPICSTPCQKDNVCAN